MEQFRTPKNLTSGLSDLVKMVAVSATTATKIRAKGLWTLLIEDVLTCELVHRILLMLLIEVIHAVELFRSLFFRSHFWNFLRVSYSVGFFAILSFDMSSPRYGVHILDGLIARLVL